MFYIRADGNEKTGMGHIMRCLTIAEALDRLGEEILFLTADEKPAGLIRERGFAVKVLGTCYEEMEAELPQLRGIFSKIKSAEELFEKAVSAEEFFVETEPAEGILEETASEADSLTETAQAADTMPEKPKVLVDSYFITPYYLEQVRLFAQVILMDDEKKAVYPCDGLVNYNIFGKTLGYERDYPAGTKLFLGCEYMPLREQFRNCHYEVRDTVKHILFTTGGGDSLHIALCMVKRLLQREDGRREGAYREEACGGSFPVASQAVKRLQRKENAEETGMTPQVWHIVCGPYHPDTEKLEALAERHSILQIHKNVTRMSELMQTCDIAVSAAGSTFYELCSIGIPTVGFYFVENQRRNMETFARLTPIRNAGDFSKTPERVLENIEKEVEMLCEEKTLREETSQIMKNIVDGRGADRLAKELLSIS